MPSMTRWIPVVAMLTAMPGTATAQCPQSLADLSNVLKIGEIVAVTDDAGKRVEGIVADLSGSELVVLERGRKDPPSRLTLPGSAISRIVLHDSRRNGTIIGAAAGGISSAVVGAGVMTICEAEGASEECFLPVVGMIAGITAAGALIGFGIDSMVKRTIYDAPSRRVRVTLSPLVTPSRRGGQVVLSY